jgi:hypothetical protein
LFKDETMHPWLWLPLLLAIALAGECGDSGSNTIPHGLGTFACSSQFTVPYNHGSSPVTRTINAPSSGTYCVYKIAAQGSINSNSGCKAWISSGSWVFNFPGTGSQEVRGVGPSITISVTTIGNTCNFAGSLKVDYICPTITPDDYTTAVSGQQTTTTAQQEYTYFALTPSALSSPVASMTWNAVVTDFQGLQPPDFLVSLGYFPTLDSFDFKLQAGQEGGYNVYNLTLENPSLEANYYATPVLYGPWAHVQLTPRVQYAAAVLPKNTPEKFKIESSNPLPLNISLSKMYNANNKFVLQYAREVPGGNTTIYVGYGYVPTPTNWNYQGNTSNGYGEIHIPGSWDTSYPNPGSVMLLLVNQNSDPSGVILQYVSK